MVLKLSDVLFRFSSNLAFSSLSVSIFFLRSPISPLSFAFTSVCDLEAFCASASFDSKPFSLRLSSFLSDSISSFAFLRSVYNDENDPDILSWLSFNSLFSNTNF